MQHTLGETESDSKMTYWVRFSSNADQQQEQENF